MNLKRKKSGSIDCGTATEWLQLVLDNETAEGEHQKLMAHLQACESCSQAFSELSLIESAHKELDTLLPPPPEAYFDELPQRVVARLEHSRTRRARILALPSSRDLLRRLTTGNVRYALALAAVISLIFVITRDFKESPPVEEETRVFEQTQPLTALDSAAKPAPLQVQLQEAPTEEPPLPQSRGAFRLEPTLDKAAPPSSPKQEQQIAPPSQEKKEALPPPAEDEPASAQAQSDADESRREELAAPEEPQPQAESHPSQPQEAPTPRSQQDEIGKAKVGPRSIFPAEPAGERKRNVLSFESTPRLNPYRSSLDLKPTRSPLPASGSRFTRALWQSQEADDEAERQRIWKGYLQAEHDTAYYHLAVDMLARSYSAGVDSSSSLKQIEEAEAFYRKMETVLQPQMGPEEVAAERERLEGLLEWKKKAEGKRD